MAVRGKVTGRVQLRDVATRLAVTAPAQLEEHILQGTREAVKPIKADVQGQVLAKMPKRNGYAGILSKAIKVSSRVSGGSKVVAYVTVTASGKAENRDLPALNRGLLKHPFFDNRSRWYPQRVPRGVVDEPIDRARDRVVEAAQKAADDYADSIVRG